MKNYTKESMLIKKLACEDRRQNKINILIALFILGIPFSWANFLVGSVYRSLTFILLGLFFVFIGGKYSYSKYNTKLFSSWTIMIMYFLLTICWAKNFSSAFANFTGLLMMYGIVFVFMSYFYTKATSKYLDYSWMAMGVLCIVFFMFGERGVVGAYGSRNTLIVFGTQTDPNEFAGVFVIPSCLSAYYIFKNNKFVIKLINIALILMEFYIILLSGSRGALISAIIAVLVTFFVFYKPSLSGVMTLILLCLMIVMFCLNLLFRLFPKI